MKSTMTLFDDMLQKVKTANGFLAALDQSGGSTPSALKAYGVPDEVRYSLYTFAFHLILCLLSVPTLILFS